MSKQNRIAIAVVVGLVAVAGTAVFMQFDGANLAPGVPTAPPPNVTPPSTDNPTPPPVYVPKDGPIQPVQPIESQADYIIDITPIGFSPEILKIKKGDSVIWTSRDKYNSHQVVSIGSPKYAKMDSPVLKLGESFRATFDVVGTFQYQDKLHPNLKGTIIVE